MNKIYPRRVLHILLLTVVFSIFFSCSAFNNTETLDLKKRIKKITLDNGMRVLLLKRQGAPVFSAQIKVKVGNVEEQAGSYGLAHFFEHLAFKGTETIGTTDYAKERALLDQIFKIGTEIVNLKKQKGDAAKIAALVTQREQLEAEQKKLVVNNEFMQIYQRHGSVDLNATTANDFTTYYVSLPVNKLELWAYMESARFQTPVMRDFFTEVSVVAEERRSRIDNSPVGLLYEAFVDQSFDQSPYGVMVVGPAADIQNYTPAVARAFYEKYYIPSRIVVSVVGNIDIKETEAIIRKYFSSIPAKEDPKNNFTHENFDPKTFPRKKVLTGPEQPRFYLGYHRPAHPHDDDIIMDVIQDIMCSGRTSRLFKQLVLDTKKASFAGCYASIPGARLDNIFTFYVMPLKGHTNSELKKDIETEIEKLMTEGPSPYELQRVKNSIDADLVYSLQSNSGLASQLAFYESLTGSWEYIYTLQDRIHAITADDVKRVLKTYFVESGEVAVYYELDKTSY
ncbi:MAG: insulinase family protein [Deltaproteobacteria bacterium]|nr:insulinase family protein [Deltaproteobacteria bacterium]